MRRRSRRGTGRSGRASGLLLPAIGVLGVGALILFLLQRNRGSAREEVRRVSETARSTVEEHVGTRREEVEPQEEAPQRPADQEQGAGETQEQDTAERQEGGTEDQEQEDATPERREELRSIIRESVRRSEEHSSYREESSTGETVEETSSASESRTSEEHTSESRTDEKESGRGQVTVVGLLAKMGETFQDTGGGRFILSSEEEGNFDLHGKEDELDEVYQQQLQAKVVGRVTDEDIQPRIMEVDEVHPA